jgi:Domain of unknown function (DUF4276)
VEADGKCLTKIRIYFEGDKSLRSGFHDFFRDIRSRGEQKRCKVEFIATGGTPELYFTIANRKHPTARNILLRDSEGPDQLGLSESLCDRQGWNRSLADSIFWMVEMMESWFHADKDALQLFYGSGFRRAALKPNPNVEEISKRDLESGLKAATESTTKGRYHKTKDAPKLLAMIDPGRVREAAPNCGRLFKTVLARLS